MVSILITVLITSVSFSVAMVYLAIVSPKMKTPKPEDLPYDFKHLV